MANSELHAQVRQLQGECDNAYEVVADLQAALEKVLDAMKPGYNGQLIVEYDDFKAAEMALERSKTEMGE